MTSQHRNDGDDLSVSPPQFTSRGQFQASATLSRTSKARHAEKSGDLSMSGKFSATGGDDESRSSSMSSRRDDDIRSIPRSSGMCPRS